MKKGVVILSFIGVLVVCSYFVISADSQTGDLQVGIGQVPILGTINSSIFICEAQDLHYEFTATDSSGGSLTLDISPENPFFIDPDLFSGQSSITSYIISGVLSKDDAGGVNIGSKLYTENVSISNGVAYDSTITNITVIEINRIPVISPIGVQTLRVDLANATFTKQVEVSDIEYDEGYGTLGFNISFSGGVSLFGISSTGLINFTATNSTPLGVFNITVCVNDTSLTNTHSNISIYCSQNGSSQSSCTNFSLTTVRGNRAPQITNYNPADLVFSALGTESLTFNMTVYDPDGTLPDVYWYVDGQFHEYGSGGSFYWFNNNFGCGAVGNHTIAANITDGLLTDYVQWNISLTKVDCPEALPSTGGGGGGGEALQQIHKFIVDKDLIKVLVKQGETQREILEIINVGDTFLNLKLSIDGDDLKRFMILSDKSFTLRPKQRKTINIDFFTRETDLPEAYTGRIIVEGDGLKQPVNVILEVKEKKPLFDVLVDTLTNEVLPGDDVKARIKMKNMGDLRNIDVLVYYAIKDFNGNIVSYKEESIAIEKELDITRELTIPKEADIGAYVVYVKVSYRDITASGTDVFTVIQEKTGIFWLILAIILILILLILVAYELGRKSPE